MAEKFPMFDEDMDIIQKLGDSPGSDNNLDWKELQAEFDKGGNLVKAYLNTLAQKLNALLGTDGAFLTGGNLLGDLNINLCRIFGLREPTESTDATTKNYVDKAIQSATENQLSKDGGTLGGVLSMGGNLIKNVGTPTDAADAATKGYVDGKILKYTNVSVPTSLWKQGGILGDSDYPYSANVPISGATQDMYPEVDFAVADRKDFQFSQDCAVAAGYVQIYAESVPNRTITLSSVVLLR